MNKLLSLRLYEEAFEGNEENCPEIIVNPLAISSIQPTEQYDIVKMQNGDTFYVLKQSWYATHSVTNALKVELNEIRIRK